jgi:predicted nucleic acid-binding protein
MYNGEMHTKEKRVYVDTSVVYGAPAQDFSQDTRRFWEAVRRGEIVIIVSDVLEEELKRSPANVRMLFESLSESQIEHVVSTPESNALAAHYIAENVVGKSSLDDCRHIALATIVHADALVSWNFKHIVNRRDGYNNVNVKLGYPKIEILTPKQYEVSHEET